MPIAVVTAIPAHGVNKLEPKLVLHVVRRRDQQQLAVHVHRLLRFPWRRGAGAELQLVHEVGELQLPPAAPAQELPSPTAAPPAAAAAVVIDVEKTQEERIIIEETDELMRIGNVKRALRSKSGRAPARFPRSHSTGHSLAVAASARPRAPGPRHGGEAPAHHEPSRVSL